MKLKYKMAFLIALSWLVIVVAVDSISTHFFGAPVLLRLTFNVGIFCAYIAMYLIIRHFKML